MKSALLVLFAVGLSSARNIVYHNVTVSSTEAISDEDILKNVAQSVYAFDQSMDEYMDWVSFDKLFETMINQSGEYSVANMGSIRSYFLKSRDYYFDAVASLYGWCSLIDIMMSAYIDLFNNYSEEVKGQQKELIIASLDNGIERMTKAVELLDKSRDHVNTGIVDLSNVMSNVSEAFRNNQEEHASRINDINKQSMNALSQSFFGGKVSINMAEAKYKPEAEKKFDSMKSAFDSIKSSFDFMKEKIKVSTEKALKIQEKLLQEIVYISGLKETVNGNRIIFSERYKFPVVKEAATELKDTCSAYQEKHIKKTE